MSTPVSGEPIDGLGSGLLWLMMLAFIYGLIQGSTNGWTAIPIASLAAGAVLFAAFAVRQRRASSPLIKPSLYDVVIRDVTQDEAGGASGSFSAVQQLASAIGAAIVTSIYFKVSAAHGGVTAMTISSFTVAMIIVACLGLVWLLPRKAAEG
jgi:hypothetical protein